MTRNRSRLLRKIRYFGDVISKRKWWRRLWLLPDRLSRARKRHLHLAVDAFLILATFAAALVLSGAPREQLTDPVTWAVMVPVLPVTLALFSYFGLYRAILRYITGNAMRSVVIGAIAGATTMLAASATLGGVVSPAVAAIHAMTMLLAVGGIRFWGRAVLRKPAIRNSTPVIIYGAGKAGQQLVAALYLGNEYLPVALVDDDTRLHGTTINGVRVFPSTDLRALTEQWQVREVLLAMPSLSRMRRRRVVSRLETLGVEVKTIPSMGDVVAGRARFTDLRPITPEDLLGRDPVPPNKALMQRNISGKSVLVTGAGGSIGSELCRQIVGQNPAVLVMLDVSEYALYALATELRDSLGENGPILVPVLGSVQNPRRMRAILRRFKVQTVYHAAAYKHVVMVEENQIEGLHNNVFGTRVIAEAAAECGVEHFILVSTDKTVRPTNIMGASKRLAELVCQALAQEGRGNTVFSMVRFGNVLGSSGSVIPRFRDQIERGGPVTVTHRDVTRYFMTIPEAAQLVIQAGAMARGGDVFVLDMGEPVRILDLARSMIRLHGLTPYMLDENGKPEGQVEDIPIRITGLQPGEKLFEELLISNNPEGTEHPRIMTASELSLSPPELHSLLEELHAACTGFDLERLRTLLLEAPIGYAPKSAGIHDLMWQVGVGDAKPRPAEARLRIVKDGRSA